MRKNVIITVVVILVVVSGGALLLTRDSGTTKTGTTPSTVNVSDSVSEQTDVNVTSTATITYNGRSFSPSSVTVNSGEAVKIVNSSSELVQFDSDPHPVHTDNQELNVNFVGAGESRTVTLKNKGVWGYHNHLDSAQTGTVIVK